MKRRSMITICIGILAFGISDTWAFQAGTTPKPSEKIVQLTASIRDGERSGIPPLSLGRLWEHLAESYEDAGQYSQAENAYNHALQLLRRSPEMAKDYAIALQNLGGLNLINNNNDVAEKCRLRALAAIETTGDKLEIARAKALLAEAYLANHKYKNARQMGAEAYSEMVSLNESNERIVGTLVSLTFSSSQDGRNAYALERARDAKSLALATLPTDSDLIGLARMALGYAEWKTGIVDGPDEEMREGIRILRKWTTPGHTYMIWALTLYATYIKTTHQTAEAKQVAEQVKAEMARMPGDCTDCTVSVYGLQARFYISP